MPEPLDNFIKTVEKNDVDDAILDTPVIENTLKKLENFGKDLCETAEKLIKKQPVKPSGPTPTYQESAFIKPKEETTLYNVTNSEDKVPVVTKSSNLFKNLSYDVHGFTASATYKKDGTGYCIYTGEKNGFGIKQKSGRTKTEINALYNAANGKTSVNYAYSNPVNSYKISLFNQGSNVGATLKYSNNSGLAAALSADKNSASAECTYNGKIENCEVEIGAYATTGQNYSQPFAGIIGRINL